MHIYKVNAIHHLLIIQFQTGPIADLIYSC